MRLRAASLLSLALIGAAPALAAEPGARVSDAWIRYIVPDRPAAGYFTLRNDGDRPIVLTGAQSPACRDGVMLHRTIQQGGVERMESVASVTIAAHGEARFAPGGFHLMCMKPDGVTPGHTVPITLRFADGGGVAADFAVRDAMGE